MTLTPQSDCTKGEYQNNEIKVYACKCDQTNKPKDLFGFITASDCTVYWCNLTTDVVFFERTKDSYTVDFFIKNTQLRNTCDRHEFRRIREALRPSLDVMEPK